MPTLTPEQQAQVNPKRVADRPSVFDPGGGDAKPIGLDFEAWLILTHKSVTAKAVDHIKNILKSETDATYQDLLTEVLGVEKTSLEIQDMDLAPATKAFTDWRTDPAIKGFEDVKEVGWLFQELQQGFVANAELDEVKHHERLRSAVNDRLLISPESTATRDTRLNTWIAVLNAY